MYESANDEADELESQWKTQIFSQTRWNIVKLHFGEIVEDHCFNNSNFSHQRFFIKFGMW